MLRFFLTFCICIAAFPAAALTTLSGQASVIDGDTIEIHGKRIRLLGIDAPESRQTCRDESGRLYRCGKTAAFYLDDLIANHRITCEGSSLDRYHRLLATCYAGNNDLGAAMVADGWAVAYEHYSDAYIEQENEAKASRKGLWAGDFQLPWLWRKANR